MMKLLQRLFPGVFARVRMESHKEGWDAAHSVGWSEGLTEGCSRVPAHHRQMLRNLDAQGYILASHDGNNVVAPLR